MKKCTIFFFSGTGNTYYIARRLAGEFNALGLDASIAAIDALNLSDIEWHARSSDLLGFGFPVYGSSLPSSCARFLNILPDVKGEKHCFAFTTQPFVITDAVRAVESAISEKGYKIRQRAHFAVPHNVPFVYHKVSREDRARIVSELERPMKALADAVVEDKEYMGHIPFDYHPLFAARLNRHYDRFRTRLSVTGECTKCGFCAANCPMRNISLDDVVTFGDKCCSCMRCINFCPSEAVLYRGKRPKSGAYRGPYEDFTISDIYKKR